MKKLKRKCPNPTNNKNCKIDLFYTCKLTYDRAIEKDSKCVSCASIGGPGNQYWKGKKQNTETNKLRSKKLKGRTFSKEHKDKISKALSNREIYWGDKISKTKKKNKVHSGKNNPNYGTSFYERWIKKYGKEKADILLEEFKEKQKEISFNKKIKTDNFQWPNYNEFACEIIDKLNRTYGYKLQHALNGGEIKVGRYFLDGYDEENNVVVEYYESYHKRQSKKDKIRKINIIKELNCKFIEIYEFNDI